VSFRGGAEARVHCAVLRRGAISARITKSSRTAPMMATIRLRMFRPLRMNVVAEGVETDAQVRFLGTIGCDELQGYLFARPMPYEQAVEWLSRDVLPGGR